MITLTVLQKRSGPIRGRHPWVFSGALKNIPEGLESGEPVKLIDEQGKFLAHGYFNSYSQIAVRIWSWNEQESIDKDFFVNRILEAYELRRRYVASSETTAYRIVYGENDLLPGLVVDKYGQYLCVQFHTKGIEQWKSDIVQALIAVLTPHGIYERSDVKIREHTTNTLVGRLYGEIPEYVEVKENGLTFLVDIHEGQKTGFFLDQRDKRFALKKYVQEKKVLNCFAYTGGFSVYALSGGAARVVSVDTSAPALKIARKNIEYNNLDLDRSEFVTQDVKSYLMTVEKEAFDVIILDPPAFVKDRHKVKEGLIGYRTINELALRLLPTAGILVTASCSTHISMRDFRFMLSEAAGRAGRTVQIIETFLHGVDHPELVAFTEGEYLKCLFCIVR
jgi:23S rRNA (cytosine1962-C5)-methyltransferase